MKTHAPPFLCLVFACSGCYAGVGPTVGVVTSDDRITVGWELSAVTATVGQSYALGSVPEDALLWDRQRWNQRTYLAWEPRFGTAQDTEGRFLFGGGGATIGMRWDAMLGSRGRTQFGAIGGLWAGGGYALTPDNSDGCGEDYRPYVSLAVGVRGSEVYLAPKVGFLEVPEICLNFSL